MERREATGVVCYVPNPGTSTTTLLEWRVGHLRQNPVGGWDEVISLKVVDSWMPHVEVEYRDFGEEWIVGHISFIHFKKEDADARETED